MFGRPQRILWSALNRHIDQRRGCPDVPTIGQHIYGLPAQPEEVGHNLDPAHAQPRQRLEQAA